MDEYYHHENTALGKYETESKLSLDALKDPGVFVELTKDHFTGMDRDGSGGLSRLELYDSQAHSKSPIEREISRVLLQNYDNATNLATDKLPSEIFNPLGSSANMGTWLGHFGDSKKTANEFTLHDLYVIENVLDPDRLKFTLDARTHEISMGLIESFSAVATAVGGLVLFETPGALPALGVLSGAFAVDAVHDFVGSNKEAYHREVDKRATNLTSWNYFDTGAAHDMIGRAIAKDRGQK